jgi:recombination protein RecT
VQYRAQASKVTKMSMNEVVKAEAKTGSVTAWADKPLGAQLKDKQANFSAALPAHIPVERFMRVVLTATQNDPALMKADRGSFFTACLKAAQDGLLPDGRDGALVIYNTKVVDKATGKEEWIAKVQWMPMIGGIRKKVRNSGTIATWDVQTVHAKDAFEFELGDDPFIKHRPYLPTQLPQKEGEKPEAYAARYAAHCDRGPMIAVYSVAVLKTGEKSRDVMSRADVERVRDNYSKRNRDKSFSPAWVKSFDEMAKKTVARRHSKVLPMSSDLDDLLRRDDALYDMDGASDRQQHPRVAGPKDTGERIDALIAASAAADEAEADEGLAAGETVDNDTVEITSPAAAKGAQDGADAGAKETTAADQETAVAGAVDKPQEGVGPLQSSQTGPAPTERDAAILADLLETGVARAESGAKALQHFLDGLEPGERKLIPNETVEGWIRMAKAAKPADRRA